MVDVCFSKPEVVFSGRDRYLEKSTWCHISAMCALILTKFGSLMQNNMQITVLWSKLKPEVEFLYGECLSVKNRSSYIIAVNRDMSTKVGLVIDFWPSEGSDTDINNMKPEVVMSGWVCNLEKSVWRHISAVADPEWHDNNAVKINK